MLLLMVAWAKTSTRDISLSLKWGSFRPDVFPGASNTMRRAPEGVWKGRNTKDYWHGAGIGDLGTRRIPATEW